MYRPLRYWKTEEEGTGDDPNIGGLTLSQWFATKSIDNSYPTLYKYFLVMAKSAKFRSKQQMGLWGERSLAFAGSRNLLIKTFEIKFAISTKRFLNRTLISARIAWVASVNGEREEENAFPSVGFVPPPRVDEKCPPHSPPPPVFPRKTPAR